MLLEYMIKFNGGGNSQVHHLAQLPHFYVHHIANRTYINQVLNRE